MKKFIFPAICTFIVGTTACLSSAFTTVSGNIDFKIENNTGAEFNYCVNGGHNYISNGSTKSFSYSVGQDFYYIENSNCGKQWFEVSSDMQGKTYKVTDL
ncbi:MAG TPA: hypothetical protein VD905_13075 [Flavobacteriales bacterium]|nr:hypothetical protein [Flavobacteriales bacterium]